MILNQHGHPISSGRDYEGATQGARSNGWAASPSGVNRINRGSAQTLTNRSRAGQRNSPILRSGIGQRTTAEVGKGFTLLSTCYDQEYADAATKLWNVSRFELDPNGQLNDAAIADLCVRTRLAAGEIFIRRIRRRLRDGLTVPLQVELLEGEFCPISLNRKLPNGNRIIQGVEFKRRRIVAYWFYLDHPHDGLDSASLTRLERVPAADVIHHFKPERAGAVRGVPTTSAVLLKDKTFRDYDDAELVRKKERAPYTGFLSRQDDDPMDSEAAEYDPATGDPLFEDSDAAPRYESVEGGTMLRGLLGEKMTLFDGDNTGQGYADYMRWQALQIAAGQEVPYPMVTGDWNGLNDRLVRAMLQPFHRSVSFDQTNLSGFQVMFGIWCWVMDAAVQVGKLDAPGYADNPWFYRAVDVRPDAFKHLHPEQDIKARQRAIDGNLSNVDAEAADNGRDIEKNMQINAQRLAQWQRICRENGVENPGNMTGVFSASNTPTSGVGNE